MTAGKKFGPPKRIRGRNGIWVPGAEFPPLIDLGFQRIPEETEGVNFMKRIMVQPPAVRDLMLRIAHVPNGGLRGMREAKLFKAQGVRPGVPDYVLPLARNGFHGLYIELKAGHGTLEPEQRAELERLVADGYCACCAWTADAAYTALAGYLGVLRP